MMKRERVQFVSDGNRLIGDLYLPREKAPCVVFCHGLASNKDSGKWPVMARALYEQGLACLAFNFRGCGQGDEWSEGDFADATLSARIRDYQAALDFLATTDKVDMEKIGAVGSSLGSCVVVAAGDPRPTAYVVLATPLQIRATPAMLAALKEKGYFEYPGADDPRMSRISLALIEDMQRYDLAASIKKITRPVLIIHGSHDNIPVADAEELYAQANPPKRLEIIEGGSHAFTDNPEHLQRVVDLSQAWLVKYLE
ncbi:MAG: alpha/beta fold hydrolase [Chloroflexota bacterium]